MSIKTNRGNSSLMTNWLNKNTNEINNAGVQSPSKIVSNFNELNLREEISNFQNHKSQNNNDLLIGFRGLLFDSLFFLYLRWHLDCESKCLFLNCVQFV